eukprot:5552471-Amphidinium_carterae.1
MQSRAQFPCMPNHGLKSMESTLAMSSTQSFHADALRVPTHIRAVHTFGVRSQVIRHALPPIT